MTTLSSPNPDSVTIGSTTYQLLAFYFPGHNTSWDNHYQVPYFGNFWMEPVTVEFVGVSGTFHTAEAAFQASKWWTTDSIRNHFETLQTGGDAFNYRTSLRGKPRMSPDYGGTGSNLAAMKQILKQKFASGTELHERLRETQGAYLLEHNSRKGRDAFWSDDHDGLVPDPNDKTKPLVPHIPSDRVNHLGKTLMELRSEFFGVGEPSGDYHVSDFAAHVNSAFPHA